MADKKTSNELVLEVHQTNDYKKLMFVNSGISF